MKIFLQTDLNDEELINKTYTVIYISYFDHFLSEDEYLSEELVCYSDIKKDPAKEKLFNSIEAKFLSVYEEIYNLAAGQVVTIDHGKLLDNIPYNLYQEMVARALKENPLCELFYPSINLISLTGYDLTHQFCIPNESINIENMVKKLSEIASNVGLFILKG